MHKLLGLLALVAVVTSNDLSVGLKDEGRKIFDEKRVASPAIWRQTNNVTVNATDGDVISRVVITDLRPEKDGDVKIVDGGEGQKNVTFELKSPTVFRGYEFQIEVYAVPDKNGSPDQQKPVQTNKLPETGPMVPVVVSEETVNDNMRKTRKTENHTSDGVNVTPYTGTMVSTTPSATDKDMKSTTTIVGQDSTKNTEEKTKDQKPNVPFISGADIEEASTTVGNDVKMIDAGGLSPPQGAPNSFDNDDVSIFTNPRDAPKTALGTELPKDYNPTTVKNEQPKKDLKVGSTIPTLVPDNKTPSQSTFTSSTEIAKAKSMEPSTEDLLAPKAFGSEDISGHAHKYVKPIPYNL